MDSERKILDSTFDNYGKYVKNLNDLTAAQEELIRTTQEYREFIAEHVLWIRSCSWPRLADMEPAAGALAWSLDPCELAGSAGCFLGSFGEISPGREHICHWCCLFPSITTDECGSVCAKSVNKPPNALAPSFGFRH